MLSDGDPTAITAIYLQNFISYRMFYLETCCLCLVAIASGGRSHFGGAPVNSIYLYQGANPVIELKSLSFDELKVALVS